MTRVNLNRERTQRILLLCVSTALSLAVLELAARIYTHEYRAANFLLLMAPSAAERNLGIRGSPGRFDSLVGWVPRPGTGAGPLWAGSTIILADGVRSNGASPAAPDSDVVLAVGDSFTFGEAVADGETWPAILERLSGHRVINGGVFGYGVDQTFLRMKALAASYRPRSIVFSFIIDDVERCELSQRGNWLKPYFEVAGEGQLRLMTAHVKPRVRSDPPIGAVRAVLGYSRLAHGLLMRTLSDLWTRPIGGEIRVHHDGEAVVCRLLSQLGAYARSTGIRVYLLAQAERDEPAETVSLRRRLLSSCIDTSAVTLIDPTTALDELRQADRRAYEGLFGDHMTPDGNAFIAKAVWRAMQRREVAASQRVRTTQ